MTNKIDYSADQPLRIYEELKAIEASLERPVSPRTCHRLFHKLEETSHSLKGLEPSKAQSIFQKAQQNHVLELRDRIVSLYGKALDRKIDFQVGQIVEETSYLENTLSKGTEEELKQGSKLLQKHITRLLHDHCLSRDKLPIIQKAKQTLQLAQQKLSGGVSTSTVPRHFEWLANQTPSLNLIEEAIDLMPGEVEELFDIALLIYMREPKQVKSRYHRLPEDTQVRIAKHLAALGGQLFIDESKTAIAFVSTAYELSGTNGVYLTEEEMQDLFSEATRIAAEAEKSSFVDLRFIG